MTVPTIRLARMFLQRTRVDPGLAARADETGLVVHPSSRAYGLFGVIDRARAGGAEWGAVHGGTRF